MAVSILVSDDIFRRLEQKAIGFDTPKRVIERLLDFVNKEDNQEKKPTISFIPDEKSFKSGLLAHKRAEIIIHMKGDEREVIHWNASRFKSTSNLRANLWSGYLRGWNEKGIISAELNVIERGTSEPGDETELYIAAIANQLSWTIEEAQEYFIETECIESDDGCPYYYLATFSAETPDNLCDIGKLNENYQTHLDLHFIDDEPGPDFTE